METPKQAVIDDYDVTFYSNDYDVNCKTVILVHGIGVSSRYFMPFALEMAKYYNVFALDLPGYGKSSKPLPALSLKELADIIHRFMMVKGLHKVTLIGHSMGCQIVAKLCKPKPTRVTKFILLAPTTNIKERTVIMQAVRLIQDFFRESLATNIIALRDYIRMGPLRYIQTAKQMINHDIEKELTKTAIPILLARGSRDPLVPHDWVNYLTALSPKISSIEIPNAAHVIQRSQPKRLTDACRKFIELS